MPRDMRIQIVLAIGLILLGNIVAAIAVKMTIDASWGGFSGSEEGLTDAFVNINRTFFFWNRVSTFCSVAGLVYLAGLLAVWFIGPKEKPEATGTSVQ